MSIKKISYTRKLDTFAGIPLLFALTGLGKSRQSSLPPHISKVAFLRMSSKRDTIYIEAAINALKVQYPNAEIFFFASNDNFEVAKLIKNVNKVIKIYPDNLKRSIKAVKSAGEFDVWIDFGIYSRFEAILTFFAKSYYKVGFKTENAHRHFPYDAIVDFSLSKHILESYSDILKLLNVKGNLFHLFIKEETEEKDNKLIIFNMFPDHEDFTIRCWNDNNWKYLLSRLNGMGYKVAIIGDKKYTEIADKFTETIGDLDVDYYVGRYDEKSYYSLLSKAILLVSVDSWIISYASSLNIATVGIYGPTSAKLYAPLSKKSININSSLSCSGCQNIFEDNECKIQDKNCMSYIDATYVEAEICKLLKECYEKI